ncbi:Cys-tRNA(Pro) deacylase [Pelagibaculum spongiae]|uniref:Cys-tRNA(Pro)/Cys-tRNA(Cys) deacylase n=1 Tax=Pelagibaculum spongiae TaxID=2080658 RepID=A0A2V1GY47_9GAMM|nr:Cys-tRNA(Pro) deacylase [Pelagibaculum spongiae]PVZ67655.1 Cys-tRNA(Pro) deacylase [Pelagibaculum spongiae]
MTPAINLAKKAKITHRVVKYQHDARAQSYGIEAAQVLGLNPQQVFKTLLAELDNGELVVGMVPVCCKLDLKKLAKVAGARKAAMADPSKAEKVTGYVTGGISPLGQKKRLRSFLDLSAEDFAEIHVSAGRRGLEIALAPSDLINLLDGKLVAIACE